jgi:hypothetical protein
MKGLILLELMRIIEFQKSIVRILGDYHIEEFLRNILHQKKINIPTFTLENLHKWVLNKAFLQHAQSINWVELSLILNHIQSQTPIFQLVHTIRGLVYLIYPTLPGLSIIARLISILQLNE